MDKSNNIISSGSTRMNDTGQPSIQNNYQEQQHLQQQLLLNICQQLQGNDRDLLSRGLTDVRQFQQQQLSSSSDIGWFFFTLN